MGTHGIAGELRIQPWSDSPDFLTQFQALYLDEQGGGRMQILSSRVHGNVVLLRVEGIDSIQQADAYRNKVLFLDREDCHLEEGRYFYQDLMGCRVLDADDGRCYGHLSDISKTGANDVWHVTAPNGREYLIPVIDEVVVEVNPAEERVTIRPLKGIFDDED